MRTGRAVRKSGHYFRGNPVSAWMKVDQGNDPAVNGLVFQARLLGSMPTTPITSRVVVVRQHLVDAIERRDPAAATPDRLLRLITARAKALRAVKMDEKLTSTGLPVLPSHV